MIVSNPLLLRQRIENLSGAWLKMIQCSENRSVSHWTSQNLHNSEKFCAGLLILQYIPKHASFCRTAEHPGICMPCGQCMHYCISGLHALLTTLLLPVSVRHFMDHKHSVQEGMTLCCLFSCAHMFWTCANYLCEVILLAENNEFFSALVTYCASEEGDKTSCLVAY